MMSASEKTKRQLLEEIRILRSRNAKLDSISHEIPGYKGTELKPHTYQTSQEDKELHNITQSNISEHTKKYKSRDCFHKPNKMILIGVGLVAFFWVCESGIHAFVFHNSSFFNELLRFDPNKIWIRSLVCFILISFSFYSQIILRQLRRAKISLQKSHDELEFRVEEHTAEIAQINEKLQLEVTERKRIEKVLRESEEKFRTMFELSPYSTVLSDLEGNIKACNRQFVKLHAIQKGPEVQIGRNVSDFFPKEERPSLFSIIKKTISEKKPQGAVEYTMLREDGTKFIAETNCAIVLDQDREPCALIATAHDITERQNAEEKLRQSEERFKVLFESAPDAYYIHDLEGRYIDANKAAMELGGYSKEEAIGKSFFELGLIEEEDIPKVNAALSDTRDGKPVGPLELTMYRKDRSKVFLETHQYPVEIGGQTVVLGIARDITERKKAEEAVRKERDKARQYLDVAGVMFVVLDAKGKVTLINRKGCEVLGYEEEEIIGKNWFDNFLPEEIKDSVSMIFNKLIAGEIESVEYYENPVITKSGEEGIIAWHNTVLRNEQGAITAILNSGQDITERKRIEEQLAKSEQLFSKAFHASPIPATITTVSDDKLLMVNDAWLRLIGFESQEEAIGKSAVDLGLWADSEDREERNINLQQDGSSGTQEIRVQTPSGRIRNCLYTAEMIDYENQPHVLSMAIDITERKQANDALIISREKIQKQNEFLNNVLESLTYPFLVIDADNYKVKIANAAARVAMLSEEMTCFMLSHKLDSPCYESDCSCPLNEIKKFGHATTTEHVHPDRNGNPQHVEVHSCPILDEKGNVTDIIEYCVDITKRRRIEKTLEENERRFRATFEQAAVGVAHVAPDGRFIRVNQRFCDIAGYTREEMLERTFQDITHPDDLDADLDYVRQVLADEISTYSMEKRYIRKDGSFVWINLTVSLLRDDSGEPKFFISVIEDITERKLTEEKLQIYQEQLRSLASELALAEERERRRIAAELHDQISQTLALSKINLQSLGKSAGFADNSMFNDIINSITNTIEQVQHLTFDLSSPTLYKFGLEKAIDELLHDQLHKTKVTYELTYDKSSKPLDEDIMVLLFQSVRELLINIIKHARAQRITVAIQRDVDDITITVNDDGVGFKADPFKSSGRRKGGFGLFNIRERLNYINGSFEIESKSGKGSRLTLKAPLKVEAD